MSDDTLDVKPDYKYLWEEYKILQDKVDKIGAYRFQVKSWMIPFVSAWLAAIHIAKVPTETNLVSLFLVFGFWLLEKNQTEHQDAFLRRIEAIERYLMEQRDLHIFLPKPHVKPEDRKSFEKIAPRSPVYAIELSNKALRKAWWGLGRLVLHAHGIFYIFITLAICAVTLIELRRAKHEDPAQDALPVSGSRDMGLRESVDAARGIEHVDLRPWPPADLSDRPYGPPPPPAGSQ